MWKAKLSKQKSFKLPDGRLVEKGSFWLTTHCCHGQDSPAILDQFYSVKISEFDESSNTIYFNDRLDGGAAYTLSIYKQHEWLREATEQEIQVLLDYNKGVSR